MPVVYEDACAGYDSYRQNLIQSYGSNVWQAQPIYNNRSRQQCQPCAPCAPPRKQCIPCQPCPEMLYETSVPLAPPRASKRSKSYYEKTIDIPMAPKRTRRNRRKYLDYISELPEIGYMESSCYSSQNCAPQILPTIYRTYPCRPGRPHVIAEFVDILQGCQPVRVFTKEFSDPSLVRKSLL